MRTQPETGSRRRAGGLPALIVLLLVLIASDGTARPTGGPAMGGTATALAGALAATPAVVATPRSDVRLVLKRAGHGIPGSTVAAASLPAFRLDPPAGWWAVAANASMAHRTVCGEVRRGRAPPAA